ncbi:MAG: ankyrin repeat domain-containing protein [Halarcobacter sp.]
MLTKLFKKTTYEDIVEELKSTNFNETKVNSMLQHININQKNSELQNFLHIVIPNNLIESVKSLLKNGINYNAADNSGETPIMLASKYGYSEIVDELLKVGANVNFENQSGYTAIEFAILNNHFDVFKQLKPQMDNINRRNSQNLTLLHLAIHAQNLNIINDLLEDKSFIKHQDILFYKHTFSNFEILNSILKFFPNPNITDSYGRSLLFYLVENGKKSEELFFFLLKFGLDINSIDIEGNNILLHLVKYIIKRKEYYQNNKIKDKNREHLEIQNLIDFISVLIEEEIDTSICNNKNETIISFAAKNKALDVLTELLDFEVNIDVLNRHNETALSEVTIKGEEFLDVTSLLLDYGASTNIKDKNEKTIIEKIIDAILALQNGKKIKGSQKKELDFKSDYKTILTGILINAEVNLSLLNSKGEPYFFDAIRYKNLELCKLLIKYGAEINQKNINDENIIYNCMDENQNCSTDIELRAYQNILHSIIMLGADVNSKDSYGGITLHKAILNCDQIAIKLLIHSGANINAIDSRGRNLIHNAIWKNNLKVFKQVYPYNKKLLNEVDKFGVLPINYAAFLGYVDFVLELIELNAHVNNPHRKAKYILNFLNKFHENLKTLPDKANTKNQKAKVQILVDNMIKEFEVK